MCAKSALTIGKTKTAPLRDSRFSPLESSENLTGFIRPPFLRQTPVTPAKPETASATAKSGYRKKRRRNSGKFASVQALTAAATAHDIPADDGRLSDEPLERPRQRHLQPQRFLELRAQNPELSISTTRRTLQGSSESQVDADPLVDAFGRRRDAIFALRGITPEPVVAGSRGFDQRHPLDALNTHNSTTKCASAPGRIRKHPKGTETGKPAPRRFRP